jgi:hypothetical protein
MIDIRHALARIALCGLILAVFVGVACADDAQSKDSAKIDRSELQRSRRFPTRPGTFSTATATAWELKVGDP